MSLKKKGKRKKKGKNLMNEWHVIVFRLGQKGMREATRE